MTDIEAQNKEQEILIHKLRAELAEAKRRCDKLQTMHDNAQRHIGRLQKIIDRQKLSEAERVFK